MDIEEKIKIRVAGIVFFNSKILLVEHNKNNKKYWVVPGGGVEFKENVLNALVREFKEELNLDISIDKFLFADEVILENKHNIDLYFLCSINGNIENIQMETDSVLCGYNFFSKEELKQINLKPDLKNIIFNLFENKNISGFISYEN